MPAHFATHLNRPDLDPVSIARAHHISARTLYRLCEGAEHSDDTDITDEFRYRRRSVCSNPTEHD